MTLLMLVFYVALGALMAWPCWLLLNRVLRARQPLVCVQPYRPSLLPALASDSAVTMTEVLTEVAQKAVPEAVPETLTEALALAATEAVAVAVAVTNDTHHAEPPAKARDAAARPTTLCSHRARPQTVRLRAMRPCRRLSSLHP
jgi:hypothetical protein